MGYQESYIYGIDENKKISNTQTEKIFQLLKEKKLLLDEDRDDGACVIAKIVLLKDISTDFGDFKKEDFFLYAVGERHPQRNTKHLFQNMLNEVTKVELRTYSKEEIKLIESTEIVFTEFFPSELIFDRTLDYAVITQLEP